VPVSIVFSKNRLGASITQCSPWHKVKVVNDTLLIVEFIVSKFANRHTLLL